MIRYFTHYILIDVNIFSISDFLHLFCLTERYFCPKNKRFEITHLAFPLYHLVVSWKRGKSGKYVEYLGKISDIIPNERHPNKALSARIEGKDPKSLYSLSQLGK